MIGSPAEIEEPIFFVGMLRSGTTLMLEVFGARSDVAWFSRCLNRVPWLPSVCVFERLVSLHPAMRSTIYRSDQIGPGLRRLRRLERLRLGPTEGTPVWRHWLGDRFMDDFLLGVDASDEERERFRCLVTKILRYEGKPRFVAKLTGPARIHYLSSIFPDARFIHVIRDGRAVVNSLLKNHPGWRGTFREREPAWTGLGPEHLQRWSEHESSSSALAAVEWRAVVEAAGSEAGELAPGRYMEIRYEDFIADPHRRLDELTAFCGLPRSTDAHAFLAERVQIRDMNYQWSSAMTEAELTQLDLLIGGLLEELGYARGIPADKARS